MKYDFHSYDLTALKYRCDSRCTYEDVIRLRGFAAMGYQENFWKRKLVYRPTIEDSVLFPNGVLQVLIGVGDQDEVDERYVYQDLEPYGFSMQHWAALWVEGTIGNVSGGRQDLGRITGYVPWDDTSEGPEPPMGFFDSEPEQFSSREEWLKNRCLMDPIRIEYEHSALWAVQYWRQIFGPPKETNPNEIFPAKPEWWDV